MYARFHEIPSMTLKDIKETNVTDGQRENSIPAPTNTVVCGGIKMAASKQMHLTPVYF